MLYLAMEFSVTRCEFNLTLYIYLHRFILIVVYANAILAKYPEVNCFRETIADPIFKKLQHSTITPSAHGRDNRDRPGSDRNV